MAIAQGMCYPYKLDLFGEGHDLIGNVIRIALYESSANLDLTQDVYTLSGESGGTGYTKGGEILINKDNKTDPGTGQALFTAGNVNWSSATFNTAGAMIYDDTTPIKRAIGLLDFQQTFSIVNGNFTILFPTYAQSSALIRIE